MNRFLEILKIDSTSGKEGALAKYIATNLVTEKSIAELYDVGDGTQNLFIKWGDPQIVFCTHLDTVPPYISPKMIGDTIYGRGTCDAKGQLISMYKACLELEQEGHSDFGLLLLAGEEIGSLGAKSQTIGGKYVIIGEPNDNRLASAGKGTKHFEIEILGKSAHSGYPHLGENAIQTFVDFVNTLNSIEFPFDEELGETTYNIGRLESDNPQNIISDNVRFRCYFRTTFASDDMVVGAMQSLRSEKIKIKQIGGDAPIRFLTLEGFETNTIAYGSDAPYLINFRHRLLYGAGSIATAHTKDEKITIGELYKAVIDLKLIYTKLKYL